MFQQGIREYFGENDSQTVKTHDKFKDFKIPQDCSPQILEFSKNKRFECQCYVYVDWTIGGSWPNAYGSQRLYQIRFTLEKDDTTGAIQMYWLADTVQSKEIVRPRESY